jgi:hypothetical protein
VADATARILGGPAHFIEKAMLEEEDPTALGLCRILLVALFTASLLTHVGAVATYFSDASVVAGDFARRAFPSRWSLFFYASDPTAVRAIFAVGVVAHLLWLVGLFTRATSLVAWALWVSMVGRNPLLYTFADQLLVVLCTLLMFLPAGRGLSLDATLRKRGGPVPVWCRRILQLQMAVVYTSTGLLKSGVTWHSEGTALYYSLVNPFNRFLDLSPLWAFLQPWALRPATWLVLVWENLFGIFVLLHWTREIRSPSRIPDLRKLILPFGVAMHAGIGALLFVSWFSLLSIASYSAFLTPGEAGKVVGWLRRRRRHPRRGPAAGE